jgi:hypothetical protein
MRRSALMSGNHRQVPSNSMSMLDLSWRSGGPCRAGNAQE